MNRLRGTCLVLVIAVTIINISGTYVPSPPSITDIEDSPFYIAVTEMASSMLLTCLAEGSPDPEYYWTLHGEEIDIDSDDRYTLASYSGNLQISTPSEDDAGTYQCFAMNDFGTSVSAEVEVIYSYLDRFTDDDAVEYEVQQYDSLTLTCVIPEGEPEPTTYWTYVPPNELEETDRISWSPTGKLIFANVLPNDESDYYCNVMSEPLKTIQLSNQNIVSVNSGSKASQSAAEIAYSPGEDDGNEVVAMRGDDFPLKCIATGYPTPVVNWTRESGGGLPSGRSVFNDYFNQLTITDIDFDDAGDYKCTAGNQMGDNYALVTLIVESTPYWTDEPESVIIAPQESHTFDCSVEGSPSPSGPFFMLNGEVFDPDEYDRVSISGSKLTVTEAEEDDTAVFQCVAENEHGTIVADFYLSVIAVAPIITTPPEDSVECVEGQEISISCEVFGSPNPWVVWYSGDVTDDSIISDSNSRISFTDEDYNHDLTISDAVLGDSGVYTCYGNNSYGSAEKSGRIEVRRATVITTPPEDDDVMVGSTAVLQCVAESDDALTVRINWLKNDQYFILSGRYSKDEDDSLVITSLQRRDSATYSCVASTTLDEVTATAYLLVADVPDAPDEVTYLQVVDDTTVRLYWEEPNDRGSDITSYTVQYKTDNYPDEIRDMTSVSGVLNAEFDLDSGNDYNFAVFATNSVGNSDLSDWTDTYTTDESAPSKNPDDLMGEGTLPTNMIISWTPLSLDEHGADGLYYYLQYRLYNAGDDWTPVTISDYEEDSYTVDDTETYTAYEISIKSYNSMGSCSCDATVVIGYSGEDNPSEAPTDVTVEVVSSDTVKVSWTAIPDEYINGKLIAYVAQYWMVDSDGSRKRRETDVTEVDFESGESEGLVTDLDAFTDYELQLIGRNGAGDSDPSDVISFSTPEAPPGQVDDMKIYTQMTGFVVMWEEPLEPNGDITEYVVTYARLRGSVEDDAQEMRKDDSTFLAEITGLDSSAYYNITVYAVNSIGDGDQTSDEKMTSLLGVPDEPDAPVIVDTGDDYANLTFTLLKSGPAAEEYYIMYWQTDEPEKWLTSYSVLFYEDEPVYIHLTGLDATQYDFAVVAKNSIGETVGPSASDTIPGLNITGRQNDDDEDYAWLIATICILLFLLIILLLICFVRRNRGGKYPLAEKEEKLRPLDAESFPHKDDEGSFPEYNALPTTPAGKAPPSGGSPYEDDDEPADDSSLDEYGDDDTGQFNEDGSFIGQYGVDKRRLLDNEESSPFATIV